jgi:hypothetical protein
MRLLPAFESLLREWNARGVKLCTLAGIYAQLPGDLPRHHIEFGEIPGRSGVLAKQGAKVE